MRVISDEAESGTRLEEMLAPIGTANTIAIFLERKTATTSRQDIVGLDDVLREAPSGRPIIMFGWLYPEHTKYADDPRWHAALGYPNVTFRRLPEGMEEIPSALDEATKRKRPADPLAIALLVATAIDRDKGILLHDLSYAERDAERMVAWLARAGKCLGDNLSPEELVHAVKDGRALTEVRPQFAGQEFPDVCVDIEGTLFMSEGIFREYILKLAESKAKSEGRPITLWTGGDLSTARTMVRKAGIAYKLVAKQLLRDACVGIVIDDLPEEKFFERYRIGHKKYHQV